MATKKGLVSKDSFAKMVKGVVDQGIEFREAVDTISEGLRQANGIPIRAKKEVVTQTENSSES